MLVLVLVQILTHAVKGRLRGCVVGLVSMANAGRFAQGAGVRACSGVEAEQLLAVEKSGFSLVAR